MIYHYARRDIMKLFTNIAVNCLVHSYIYKIQLRIDHFGVTATFHSLSKCLSVFLVEQMIIIMSHDIL